MALQPKIIACGNSVAAFAMAVRFLTGPAVMAAASIAVGLRGTLLHLAIVQVTNYFISYQNLLPPPSSLLLGLLSYICSFFANITWNICQTQAALPQGIVPFVFAKEYNVHPAILSTG